eukprot:gene15176-21249_t
MLSAASAHEARLTDEDVLPRCSELEDKVDADTAPPPLSSLKADALFRDPPAPRQSTNSVTSLSNAMWRGPRGNVKVYFLVTASTIRHYPSTIIMPLLPLCILISLGIFGVASWEDANTSKQRDDAKQLAITTTTTTSTTMQVTASTIRRYPSTLIMPLLLLCILISLGIFGVASWEDANTSKQREDAKQLAITTASSFEHTIEEAYPAIASLDTLIDLTRLWSHTLGNFSVSMDRMTKLQDRKLMNVQIAPQLVISAVYPPGDLPDYFYKFDNGSCRQSLALSWLSGELDPTINLYDEENSSQMSLLRCLDSYKRDLAVLIALRDKKTIPDHPAKLWWKADSQAQALASMPDLAADILHGQKSTGHISQSNAALPNSRFPSPREDVNHSHAALLSLKVPSPRNDNNHTPSPLPSSRFSSPREGMNYSHAAHLSIRVPSPRNDINHSPSPQPNSRFPSPREGMNHSHTAQTNDLAADILHGSKSEGHVNHSRDLSNHASRHGQLPPPPPRPASELQRQGSRDGARIQSPDQLPGQQHGHHSMLPPPPPLPASELQRQGSRDGAGNQPTDQLPGQQHGHHGQLPPPPPRPGSELQRQGSFEVDRNQPPDQLPGQPCQLPPPPPRPAIELQRQGSYDGAGDYDWATDYADADTGYTTTDLGYTSTDIRPTLELHVPMQTKPTALASPQGYSPQPGASPQYSPGTHPGGHRPKASKPPLAPGFPVDPRRAALAVPPQGPVHSVPQKRSLSPAAVQAPQGPVHSVPQKRSLSPAAVQAQQRPVHSVPHKRSLSPAAVQAPQGPVHSVPQKRSLSPAAVQAPAETPQKTPRLRNPITTPVKVTGTPMAAMLGFEDRDAADDELDDSVAAACAEEASRSQEMETDEVVLSAGPNPCACLPNLVMRIDSYVTRKAESYKTTCILLLAEPNPCVSLPNQVMRFDYYVTRKEEFNTATYILLSADPNPCVSLPNQVVIRIDYYVTRKEEFYTATYIPLPADPDEELSFFKKVEVLEEEVVETSEGGLPSRAKSSCAAAISTVDLCHDEKNVTATWQFCLVFCHNKKNVTATCSATWQFCLVFCHDKKNVTATCSATIRRT